MITRLFCICIMVLAFFSCREDASPVMKALSKDVSFPLSFELRGNRVWLPQIHYFIDDGSSDSVVELRFFSVEEHEDGISWEEGMVKVSRSGPLQYGGMYLPHHRAVWRYLP